MPKVETTVYYTPEEIKALVEADVKKRGFIPWETHAKNGVLVKVEEIE